MTVTSPLILFGRNALTIKNDIDSITSSDAQSFVDYSDLETEVSQTRYITFEPDYWILDGTYHFMPAAPHVGYWSGTLSGSGSNFAVAPTLTTIFTSVHSTVEGLTLYFSQLTNDYTDSITIAFYDSSNVLIRSDSYTPSSWQFSTGQAVSNFKKIILTFNSTNKNYRYARLFGIDFDAVFRFGNEEVKDARLIEEVNLINAELPHNTLELTLFSDDPDFSIVAPSGFFANLQYREPLEAFERVDDQTLFMGRFYLDDWKSENEHRAKFRAIDLIGLIDSIADIGGYINQFLDDTLDIILVDRAGVEYSIDSYAAGLAVGIYLPGTNAREALQYTLMYAAFNRYVIASCARSRVIEITSKNYSIFNPDTTLAAGDINKNTQLTLKPVVTAVKLFTDGFYINTTTETIFSETFATGNHTVILDYAPWDTTSYSISGATITESNRMYVIINVTVAGTITLTGKRILLPKREHVFDNIETGGNAEPFMVAVDDLSVSFSTVDFVAALLLDYYRDRYVLETRIIAPLFAPGDKIVAPVQGGKYIAGFVERMDSDLAGGFLSDIRVVGSIVNSIPATLTAGKYNDTNAGLAYYGSWATSSDASAYSGDLHTTLTGEDAILEFAFTGTQLTIVYTQHASHGFMRIWIDDASVPSLNQNGATVYQKEWDSSVLSAGIHYVRITNFQGSIVDIDAVEIT